MALTWDQVAYYITVCVTATTYFEPKSFDDFISLKFLFAVFASLSVY